MAANLCRVALGYAKRGWRVLPITPRKTPYFKGGHKVGTVGLARIWLWCHSYPRAKAIGICTGRRSGIWVMDVDPRNGGDETLAALVAKCGPIPATLTASTPSGGRHFYFEYPDRVPKITSTSNKIGPGIDQRGDNGYIVAPGSSVAHGDYEWTSPAGTVPVLAPRWLLLLALAGHKVVAEDEATKGLFPTRLVMLLDDMLDN